MKKNDHDYIAVICDYIDHLRSHYGLRVSIHGAGLVEHFPALAPYNIHECALCTYIKSSAVCRERCKESQRRALIAAEGGAFFGSCYAGVGEFVFPVTERDRTVAFISVSAYRGSAEKEEAFIERYEHSELKIRSLAERELSRDIPDMRYLKMLIEPLSATLTLLFEHTGGPLGKGTEIYGKILSILHNDYSGKLTVSDIASACHYSPSFISRYFKKISGESISTYLFRLRMEKAEELLLKRNMSIEDIASAVGFSDTNYFISSFSRHFGLPPKKYKAAHSDKSKTASIL